MKKTSSPEFALLIALFAASACGTSADKPVDEDITARADPAVGPGAVWTAATTTVDAIKNLYTGINWFNCEVLQTCPESEAHIEATRVIDALESTINQIDTDSKISDVNTLLDRAALDYAHPSLVTVDEEQGLVNAARDVYFHFRDRLNDIDATNLAQVNQAYALAPFFNILAALVDNIGQNALRNGRVPMDWGWIDDKRASTLAVNYALVGAQSLWYQCPDVAGPSLVDTRQSPTNAFTTKKLWGKFASYPFTRTICSDQYTCNVFNRVTNPSADICSRTKCSLGGLLCHACGGTGDTYYNEQLPNILAAMDRDPVVVAVRAATEKLVGLASEHGSGLLFRQPSGRLDVWNLWSDTSYRPRPLSTASSAWQPLGTGDFNGDGIGDILWGDWTDRLLSIWTLDATGAPTPTPATVNFPQLDHLKIFTGDRDGDGITDVIFTGSTSFSPPQSMTTITTYISLQQLWDPSSTTPRSSTVVTSTVEHIEAVGDFDGDALHRADILYRSPATGAINLQISGGSRISLGTVAGDWVIEGVGDFNGDHTMDIAWRNINSGLVSLWEMSGGQLAVNPLPGVVPSGSVIRGVADVDHDGISDLLIGDASGGTAVWLMDSSGVIRDSSGYFPSAGGTFAGVVNMGPGTPANIPASSMQESYCGVSSGSLRNPGFSQSQDMFRSLFDGGHGTFLGDVTGDGKADLVGLGDGYVGVLNTNDGLATYEQWRSDSAWRLSDGTVLQNLLGDVTGDNKADLVALGGGQVRVMRSNTTSFGNFESWSPSDFTGTHGTLLGDVDGDGKADLVALYDGVIGVNRSTGGSFGGFENWYPGTFFAQPGGATLLGDVTGDGKADLVAVINGSIVILRSTGSSFGALEVWASPSTFFGAAGSHGIFLADVDGDGRGDVVAVSDQDVRVMRSTGSSFSSQEVWFSVPYFGNHGTFLGDVDANGKSDLVIANDFGVGVLRAQ